MEYELIRSKRKSISVQIDNEGRVIVKAPLRVSKREIDSFIISKEAWIRKHVKRQQLARQVGAENRLSEADIKNLIKKAKQVIPERVSYYAPLIGVDYGRISLRFQRTRWGSCSSKGNLNFNCLLMLAPEAVIDSIVVHELCHRKEMNHSAKFYAEVRRVFPRYDICNKWLKHHGSEIMARLY